MLYAVALKKWDKALQDLTTAIALKPQEAYYYENRGHIYFDSKQYEIAIADYSKAIELELDEASYYIIRGSAYYYLQQYNVAIADYNKAIELDGDVPNYYGNLCQLYFITGESEKALVNWQQAFERKPEQSALLAELWFYAYAHIPEKRQQAAEKLQELITSAEGNALSPDWPLAANIAKALKDGHPDPKQLQEFAGAISGEKQ